MVGIARHHGGLEFRRERFLEGHGMGLRGTPHESEACSLRIWSRTSAARS